jgi:hypothetical protein
MSEVDAKSTVPDNLPVAGVINLTSSGCFTCPKLAVDPVRDVVCHDFSLLR